MRKYTPRRAGKHWLIGAPEYVLDCIRHKVPDGNGFDILFTGSLLGTIKGEPQDFSHVYVMGLDLQAEGDWCSFELDAYRAMQYRRACSRRRVKWADLPAKVQAGVIHWATAD
jgi:hypothetical protein